MSHELRRFEGSIALKKNEQRAYRSGGMADVWRGELTVSSSGKVMKVALKSLRSDASSQTPEQLAAMTRAFQREVRVWKTLEHANVLSMLGLWDPSRISPRLNPAIDVLVSPLCSNGNILEYLKAHPNSQKYPLVIDVLKGLIYLHRQNVVHGDLKPPNVVVDDQGHALLTDFGLSRIAGETGFTTKNSASTPRYSAPELLDDGDRDFEASEQPAPRVTPESDIWAFGMTIVEVLSEKAPFYRIQNVTGVVTALNKERRPNASHYPEIEVPAWRILQDCWKQKPSERSTLDTLYKDFSKLREG